MRPPPRSARPTQESGPSRRYGSVRCSTAGAIDSGRITFCEPAQSGFDLISCSHDGGWRCSSTAASGTNVPSTAASRRATLRTGSRSCRPTWTATAAPTQPCQTEAGSSSGSGSTRTCTPPPTSWKTRSGGGKPISAHLLVGPAELGDEQRISVDPGEKIRRDRGRADISIRGGMSTVLICRLRFMRGLGSMSGP
jgi:hypothetical protein